MTFHSVYGLTIGSDLAIPELPPADPPAHYAVTWNADLRAPGRAHWSVIWRTPSGEPWVTTARAAGARYFLFRRYMAVLVRETAVHVARLGFTAPHTLRHLFLDQAFPLILAGDGHIVLHASAVQVAGHAVLLTGATGAGKSTLAAQLSRLGAGVMADDGVLLRERDGILGVAPSYPGLRLFDDASSAAGLDSATAEPVAAYSTKRRFTAGAAGGAPLPLGLIYVLDDQPGATAFSPLSPRDTVMAVLRHAFRDSVEDAQQGRAQLETAVGWASRVCAWRLTHPRQIGSSAAVAAALLSHAGEMLGERQS